MNSIESAAVAKARDLFADDDDASGAYELLAEFDKANWDLDSLDFFGHMLFYTDRNEEALALANSAILAFGENAQLLLLRGSINAYELDDQQSAQRDFESAYATLPKNPRNDDDRDLGSGIFEGLIYTTEKLGDLERSERFEDEMLHRGYAPDAQDD